MIAADVIRVLKELPPIRVADPLMVQQGLLAEGQLDEVRVTDFFSETGFFHPHVAGAFRLCQLAAIALEKLLEGPPIRGEILVVVHGQVRDLSNGLMSQVFSRVFGAYHENGFKGWHGHHQRRRLMAFEQEDFNLHTFDVVHWKSGSYATVRMEPEELPYSVALNNILFKYEKSEPNEAELAQFPTLWGSGIYDTLLSPEAQSEKVYFVQSGHNFQHEARSALLADWVERSGVKK